MKPFPMHVTIHTVSLRDSNEECKQLFYRNHLRLMYIQCQIRADRKKLGTATIEFELKSHSLRKSDTSQYGLEIEKIDFSETLPIFNLY